MKVLLFNGSPHKAGCTNAALTEISGILEQHNIEAQIIHVGSVPYRGCIGCGACRRNKDCACVFGEDDGLNEMIALCKDADGFVFGSPVYYASANGTLISFMDRLFYAGSKNLSHKPAAAVAVARRAGTTATLDEINKYFTINQMPVVSSTYWNMVHGRGLPEEAAQDLEGMQTMRNLGRNMAWLLQCIRAGKEAGVQPPTAEREHMTNFIR